ncbi:MAG: hypothetical protein WDW38_011260 [Sanguina aurantia]
MSQKQPKQIQQQQQQQQQLTQHPSRQLLLDNDGVCSVCTSSNSKRAGADRSGLAQQGKRDRTSPTPLDLAPPVNSAFDPGPAQPTSIAWDSTPPPANTPPDTSSLLSRTGPGGP